MSPPVEEARIIVLPGGGYATCAQNEARGVGIRTTTGPTERPCRALPIPSLPASRSSHENEDEGSDELDRELATEHGSSDQPGQPMCCVC